ncbi:MAG: hypothetical protein NVS3B1_08720 [Marmoricola sp.]
MPESVTPLKGNIVTDFDGLRWCNRVVGSYIVANYRDTAEEAALKGQAMAQMRRVDHLVKDRDGEVVSHIRYGESERSAQ